MTILNDAFFITVASSSNECLLNGLSRTHKTIRSWARNGDVEARKQTTQNGSQWLIDKASLEIKIQQELEFQAQQEARQAANTLEQGSHSSAPVQTGSNPSAPSRRDDEYRDQAADREELQSLRSQVQELKVDVGWRSKMLEKLTRENDEGREALMSQSRYIGHLETQLLELGGKPDQQFLSAPIPQTDTPTPAETNPSQLPEIVHQQEPHPDQRTFFST